MQKVMFSFVSAMGLFLPSFTHDEMMVTMMMMMPVMIALMMRPNEGKIQHTN